MRNDQIDARMTDPRSGHDGTRDAGGDLRERWLQILQQAGLDKTLAQVKTFEAAVIDFLPRNAVLGNSAAQGAAATRASDENAERSVLGAAPAESPFEFETAPTSPGTAGQRTELRPYGQLMAAMSAPEHQGSAISNVDREVPIIANARDVRQWSPSRFSVLSAGDRTVEVWVRDAAMTEAQLRPLLDRLRASIGATGRALVRASLNGKLIYRDDAVPPQHSKHQGD